MRLVRVQCGGRMTADPVMSGPVTAGNEANEIERLALSSGYMLGNLVSLDEHAALIRAGFAEHRSRRRRVFAPSTRPSSRWPTTRSGSTSQDSRVRTVGSSSSSGQVLIVFAAAIVLTWFLLYRYFRDWRGALRPTISGGLAAIWGFGLVQLSGSRVNPLTAGHPVPHHGERGEPLGPDARPLLRGARAGEAKGRRSSAPFSRLLPRRSPAS